MIKIDFTQVRRRETIFQYEREIAIGYASIPTAEMAEMYALQELSRDSQTLDHMIKRYEQRYGHNPFTGVKVES